MVEITHQHQDNAPTRLRELEQTQPVPPWAELRGQAKNDLKKLLRQEQQGLCVYCERQLVKGGGRIDHIKPRDKYQHLKFTYTNLCLSCYGYYDEEGKSKKISCDEVKSNIELGCLEPGPGANESIELDPKSGKLSCSLPLDDADRQTIEATLESLGLQNRYLQEMRKERYNRLFNMIKLGRDPLQLLEKTVNFYWTLHAFFRKPRSIPEAP